MDGPSTASPGERSSAMQLPAAEPAAAPPTVMDAWSKRSVCGATAVTLAPVQTRPLTLMAEVVARPDHISQRAAEGHAAQGHTHQPGAAALCGPEIGCRIGVGADQRSIARPHARGADQHVHRVQEALGDDTYVEADGAADLQPQLRRDEPVADRPLLAVVPRKLAAAQEAGAARDRCQAARLAWLARQPGGAGRRAEIDSLATGPVCSAGQRSKPCPAGRPSTSLS